jgi:hypothetical protein
MRRERPLPVAAVRGSAVSQDLATDSKDGGSGEVAARVHRNYAVKVLDYEVPPEAKVVLDLLKARCHEVTILGNAESPQG